MQLKCETKTTIDLSHFRLVLAPFFVLVSVNEIDLFSFCAIFVFVNANYTGYDLMSLYKTDYYYYKLHACILLACVTRNACLRQQLLSVRIGSPAVFSTDDLLREFMTTLSCDLTLRAYSKEFFGVHNFKSSCTVSYTHLTLPTKRIV